MSSVIKNGYLMEIGHFIALINIIKGQIPYSPITNNK
jgi:hypothetical protein